MEEIITSPDKTTEAGGEKHSSKKHQLKDKLLNFKDKLLNLPIVPKLREQFHRLRLKWPGKGGNPLKKINFKKMSRKKKIITVAALILVLAAVVGMISRCGKKKDAVQVQTAVAERRDISNSISGSAVLEAKDAYSITATVSGEVVECYFEEGDTVEKGDKLYKIDSTTAENALQSAQNAITKARQSYNDAVRNKSDSTKTNQMNVESARSALEKAERDYKQAVESKNQTDKTNTMSVESAKRSLEQAQRNYAEALDDRQKMDISADITGKVGAVYVKEGEAVGNGGKICDVYNDTYMKVRVPFNDADAQQLQVGDGAVLTVVGTGNEIYGSVTRIDAAVTAEASHALVRYVTIETENPGALTTADKATAVVGNIACNNYGTFEYIDQKAITAEAAGTISYLYVKEGDVLYKGTVFAGLEPQTSDNSLKKALDSIEEAQSALDKARISAASSAASNQVQTSASAIDDAKNSLEKAKLNADPASLDSQIANAKLSLDDAQLSLEKAEKTLEDYTITAPISGKVVRKNTKTGDKVGNNTGASEASVSSTSTSSSASSAMAVIYDLSNLEFDLSVDEMDVADVKEGMEVIITADAVEHETFTGYVTKVGIDGTASNGVTTYPVTVELDDYGDLIPGMNIDAEIVIEQAEQVLAVPMSAVNRGNTVFVLGDKESDDDQAPEGFKTVRVTTGINDSSYIEITNGLSEGDQVRVIEAAKDEQQLPMGMQGMGGDPGGEPGGMGGGPGGGSSGGHGGMSGGPGGMR